VQPVEYDRLCITCRVAIETRRCCYLTRLLITLVLTTPVRFVEAFVDQLDLQEAGFCRVEPKETGRPGYDPADLLKLYIYGYLNRVRSSRRLEAETRRNLEVILATARAYA
jgi:hypothetical protein